MSQQIRSNMDLESKHQATRFYCIVTCGCGSDHFTREVIEHSAQAILKCNWCRAEYRQPSVRYIPMRVPRR